MPGYEPIAISTYEDLLEQEPELLHRISELPHGGQLFLMHPLQLFADVGADLPPQVQQEFTDRHGGDPGWSLEPYLALRDSALEQTSRVQVHGLFRRSA
jgi:hypothetical protein